MITQNRHLAARKLYEALVERGMRAGVPITWGDLRDFMVEEIDHPDRTYIKALQFSSAWLLPETFDVWDQFAWEPTQNSVYLAVMQSDSAPEHQTKVSDWLRDLTSATGPAAEIPVKMYWTSHPHGPRSGDRTYDFSIIYDDRTNVVFIAKDLTGSGKSLNDVHQYIDSVLRLADTLNLNGVDSESIMAIPRETLSQLADAQIDLLTSLLRPEHAGILRQNRYEPNQNAANPAAPENTDDNSNDDNDELNSGALDLDDFDDDQADGNPDDDKDSSEKKETADGEDCNGIRVLGEITAADIPSNWPGGDYAIAFGGESFDDFKRGMRQYPRDAVRALTSKPVRYCRVDFGNPNGAKKAYLDVYRNFRFFIFESKDDIRWYQSNKGNAAFFKMSSGNTPRDMFAMLRGGRSGLEFIGFFYGRVRAEARRGGTAIENIWSASERFAKMTSTTKSTSGAQQTPTGKKISDFQRRRYIENVILQRLQNELVDKYHIYRPITKNSDRSVILAGAPPTNGRWHRRMIKSGAAKRLAASYDDWHWMDNPNTRDAQRLLDLLTRLLDPTGIEPPPEQEKIILPPEEQEKLDKALDAVNEKLGDAGIEIQITVPGHKPQYKWQQGFVSQQGQGWPADGRFFAVMIAGIDPQKLFDAQAEQFLKDMGMWRYIQGAYDEAKKEYSDIRLAVALDNGL